ncbi:E3 ubiquitin-protein ligase TRIM56-like [Ptychodera flava]|uniref:E3 ubiquitin-protein ligase TRIM56-like n=1 Tax=Ptychodera flava TaxID=63121 RepID=UPI00396A9EEB
MASVRETGFPDVDDNFLSCSICSEHYKNAKMLPCLHTFCESCIEKLAKKSGEVTCPICRRSHALPESGVAGVEENTFMNDMVNLFSKRVRISEKLQKCEVCGQADSAKHCVECAVDMCEACASRHSRARSTKSHRLLTMEDYETAKSNDPASIQPPSTCNYHQDSQLELYCVTWQYVIIVQLSTILGQSMYIYI